MRKALSLGAAIGFMAAASASVSPAKSEEQGACWQALVPVDQDGDGLISAREAEAALDRAFLRIDANRDGVVTPREHQNCLLDDGNLVALAATPRRTQKRFAEIDADGDGFATWEEHMRAAEAAFAEAAGGEPDVPLARYAPAVGEQGSGMPDIDGDERITLGEAALDVARAFVLMDVDGDRRLSRLEWATVTERPRLARSFAALDSNGDRRLTQDELRQAWMAAAQPDQAVSHWRYAQLCLLPDAGGGSEAGVAAGGSSGRRPGD